MGIALKCHLSRVPEAPGANAGHWAQKPFSPRVSDGQFTGRLRRVTTSTSQLTRSHRAATRAAKSEWTRRIAGVGIAARSVLYAILGLLVFQVASSSGRRRAQSTDSTGALHAVARQPFGRAMLVLLALGFAAYALWRFAEAAVAHPGRERDALIRLIDAGRGFVYCGLCALAVGTIVGSRHAQTSGQEQEWTGRVMSWPGGRVLVAAVGIGVIGAGLANAWHLIDGSWRRNIDLDRCPPKLRPSVTGFAVVGLLGRVFVFLAVGVFVVKAAVQYDPREAVGLDGALHRLARAEYGTAVLVAVAIGFLAYAAYSVVEAILRPSAES
jgi:Domain of Unknown Function (DUF1206)